MLDLFRIDISEVTFIEQVEKTMEEYNELLLAVLKKDIENTKEEFCDLITAANGLLEKIGITNEEIMRYYNNEHKEKLKARNNKPRMK